MSQVQFIPYQSKYEIDCLNLLKSNLGDYFARDEVADFIMFLQEQVQTIDYFIGLLEKEVVACGGWEFIKDQNGKTEAFLRWGMVDRKTHNRGLGSALLEFRLASIRLASPTANVVINTSGQAHGFFEQKGFKTIRIKKHGIATGIDKYQMKLSALDWTPRA